MLRAKTPEFPKDLKRIKFFFFENFKWNKDA
jgi:hypothetical protein